MPTYEYVCDACQHQFEEFQSITSPVMRKCPNCKKLKLRRLIGTGAGIIFRGSGFYQTDYRSESYKKSASAEKASSSGSDSKTADTKPADAKPAAKSDTAAAGKAGN